jgi:hypothetical protein
VPKRSSRKRPTDINQLTRLIVDEAKSERDQSTTEEARQEKNSAAVALGKLSGKKGGPARAAKLSSKKRKEIAMKAARTRWNK